MSSVVARPVMLRTVRPKINHNYEKKKYSECVIQNTFFFIIVIVFNRSSTEFKSTRKKWFWECQDGIFSDFLIFSFHRKIQTFLKKFLSVFVIHRIDKFIKILMVEKFSKI